MLHGENAQTKQAQNSIALALEGQAAGKGHVLCRPAYAVAAPRALFV